MTIDGGVLEYVNTEKKANHQANVVRIKTIYPHPDPETINLELIEIDGYQVVVRKGEFQIGDLAVYIQPDSVVPQTEPFKFIWEGHVGLDGTVPAKRRRITVRKFRGEWSEGLLLPVTDFPTLPSQSSVTVGDLEVGDDVSDLLGITHYDPDADKADTKAPQANAPKVKSKYPKTFKGWVRYIWYKVTGRGRRAEALLSVPFHVPTYDVDALKNYKSAFSNLDPNNPDDLVVVTEKIHGSNARFLYLGGTMYAGSKNQWKAPGQSVWHEALKQNPWIEDWCRSNEGCALYGEVVPTQGKYNYGCKKGEVKFYAFDIYNTDGKWLNFEDFRESLSLTGKSEVVTQAPLLYYGPYSEKLLGLADGPSWVFEAKHIREGFVIKTAVERHVRGLGRLQLKVVSNDFLAKDSK